MEDAELLEFLDRPIDEQVEIFDKINFLDLVCRIYLSYRKYKRKTKIVYRFVPSLDYTMDSIVTLNHLQRKNIYAYHSRVPVSTMFAENINNLIYAYLLAKHFCFDVTKIRNTVTADIKLSPLELHIFKRNFFKYIKENSTEVEKFKRIDDSRNLLFIAADYERNIPWYLLLCSRYINAKIDSSRALELIRLCIDRDSKSKFLPRILLLTRNFNLTMMRNCFLELLYLDSIEDVDCLINFLRELLHINKSSMVRRIYRDEIVDIYANRSRCALKIRHSYLFCREINKQIRKIQIRLASR